MNLEVKEIAAKKQQKLHNFEQEKRQKLQFFPA